jgi:type I restriction enzyme S subunit
VSNLDVPKGWSLKTLNDLFEISAGGDWNTEAFTKDRDGSHIYAVVANALQVGAVQGWSSYFTKPGKSLTVTGRGDVGKAVFRSEPYVPIVRLLSLIPRGVDSARFFSEFINSYVVFPMESTGVPQLTAPQIRPLEVLCPPVREQVAIECVLADLGDFSTSLERLIAKKRDIKQGMMQELLTGRTRLPGFTERWADKTLGNVAHIKTGSRNNQDKQDGGLYPFFVRSATVERINSYSYDTEAILVPGEGGIGSIFHYINDRFEVHQRVYKISDFKGVDGKFIYYHMRHFFGAHAMEGSVKATVDSLRLPTFCSFHMHLPQELDEQRAITEVLTDIDIEIVTLERRLASASAVKTGMMQELLTGRTRLPVPEAVA